MYELNYTLNINILLNFKQGIEIEGTSKTNNDQASLNGDALMKVNSYVEEQFSKDDEIIVSKSEPSPSITSSVASKGILLLYFIFNQIGIMILSYTFRGSFSKIRRFSNTTNKFRSK
ncbi:unnamed protein product [Trifolium pratense]|uniref:Uncharacterized protein n=1 Tax=Trifolium pratense TaxID=57577 RepID=A0ACB0L3X5_TRIPR|nr:unnamed protein product [Trifolium pratense]